MRRISMRLRCVQGAAASGHLGYDPFFLGASASMATVATAQGGIRLRLLGEPKLDLGTDAFPLERKDAALLALLAIDGAIARSKAAALLMARCRRRRRTQ